MLYLNGKGYREMLIFFRERDKLAAVNEIGMKKYLHGVLPEEMSIKWPMEALKAQAIVSRTYALYQTVKNKDRNFPLQASIISQA